MKDGEMVDKYFKRYEFKYLISRKTYEEMLTIFKDLLLKDEYFESLISNIYYDTSNFSLIRKSLEKPFYKEKLRLRTYGKFKDDNLVFVELKKKYDGIVYKRREKVNYLDINNYLNFSSSQIGQEINYFLRFYPNLERKMFISYERKSYYYKDIPSLRITFDDHILYRLDYLDFKYGIFGDKLLDDDVILMEIKSAVGLPLALVNFLSSNHLYKQSFSKYGEAYKEIIKNHEQRELIYG